MDIHSSICFTFNRFKSTGRIHSGLYARKTSKHNADLVASAFAHAGLRLQAHLCVDSGQSVLFLLSPMFLLFCLLIHSSSGIVYGVSRSAR